MAPDIRLDDLTAREREVLDLVRLGLTNEEIASRLAITEAGVKYHVSQILSKLGVATREEAAAAHEQAAARDHVAEAFQPRRGRRWWAALPLAAKAASIAVVLVAVAGLGVLAWGVVRTDRVGSSDHPEESGSSDYYLRVPRSPNDPAPNERPGVINALCIDAIDVDPSLEGEMKNTIEATIAGVVLINDSWRVRYADTVIHLGCPYPPIDYSQHPGGRLVDQGSYYDAFIYILAAETIGRYFDFRTDRIVGGLLQANRTVHLTAEETSCFGDDCGQETYGLYLTPEDLTDPAIYLDSLCWAIGAGMPRPTDWAPNPCNNYGTSPTP